MTYLIFGVFSVFISHYATDIERTSNSDRISFQNNEDCIEKASFVQIVKINSSLTEEGLVQKAKERAEQFRAMPGLIQKYYVKLSDQGDYAGVYIWDTRDSFLDYKKSDLAKTIGEAYLVTEAPEITLGDMLFTLRE